MLRHALASAMAANKEPASIIAAQLRHADGARSPSASTSTSSPRPHPGSLG
jgi:integrase